MDIRRQVLAGVEDAVVCYWEGDLCNKVEVKDLTKKQILAVIEEWGWAPGNATIFYYNQGNWQRLKELWDERKVRLRGCDGLAYEIVKGEVKKENVAKRDEFRGEGIC